MEHHDLGMAKTVGRFLTGKAWKVLVPLAVTVWLIVALPGQSNAASTLTVGTSPGCGTIQTCIDVAAPGDLVVIPAGAYNESVTLTKAVTLSGASSGTTTITAVTGRVLTVTGATVDATVTISGLTLTGGDVDTGNECAPGVPVFTNCGGGMLLADNAQPLLSDIVLSGNAAWEGGGLYTAPGSAFNATNVSFINNTSQVGGGGARVEEADVSWAGGVAIGNTSTGSVGGAMAVTGPNVGLNTVSISDVSFVGNQALGAFIAHGGAIYGFHVDLTVSNSSFTDNSCTSESCDGGAIYVMESFTDTALVVTDTTFTDNVATRGGGAILANVDSATIIGSTFSDNTAGQGGGLQGLVATITDTTFNGNRAIGDDGEGGGARITFCPTISGSSFTGNSAARGGGISCRFAPGSLTNTDFVDNTATGGVTADGNGGGVLIEFSATLAVVGGTFNGNDAADRGGAVWSSATFSADGTDFTNNIAKGGGAIHVQTGDVSLIGGVVESNVSNGTLPAPVEAGGGVSVGGDLVANGTTFRSNTSVQRGGAAYVVGTVDITDVVAESNTASSGGGFFAFGDATVNGGSFTGNHAIGSIGGAVVSSGSVVLNDAAFSENTAVNSAGAVFGRAMDVANSVFTDNEAGSGGALSMASTSIIDQSTFVGNDATSGDGGAVQFTSGFETLTVVRSEFTDNTASRNGGAVSIFGISIDIQRTLIDNNTAGGDGGGVYTGGQTFTDKHTIISNNTATGQGGGIFANSGGTLTGTVIKGNTATDGGGVSMPLGKLNGVEVSITRNTATVSGGGAHTFDANLHGSTISNNSAGTDGGGLRIHRRGIITDTHITGNSAGGMGGGISRDQATGSLPLEILRSTIDNNSSVGPGDGIHIAGTLPMLVRNSTFSDDTLSATGAVVKLENVTLFNPGASVITHSTSTFDAINVLAIGSCSSPLIDNGGNIESPGNTCGFSTADVASAGLVDPDLNANGGSTPTHALPLTSLAVDGGVNPCPSIDQRGASRVDLACDVGAYEFQPVSGCSPGFWKQRNHFDSWVELAHNDALADLFDRPLDGTLLNGLTARGGALDALLRQAVAAALNATSPDVQPGPGVDSLDEVVGAFQTAYDSGSYESAKNAFEATNTAGCPLS